MTQRNHRFAVTCSWHREESRCSAAHSIPSTWVTHRGRRPAGPEVFAFSDCGCQRPAPSYTLDTVRQFQRQYGPQTTIHWLLGADAVGDLAHWYRVRELIDECHVTTMQRAGYEPPDLDRFESIWGPPRGAKLKGDT